MHDKTSQSPAADFQFECKQIYKQMADKKKKQLVLVIEGTAALAPFWRTIFFDYLQKLIRLFSGNVATTGSSSSGPNVELALVIFNTHNSYSSCFIQRSSWTRNVDLFLEWLSAIHFTGGGFCEAAIAEGLAEALLMFSSPNGSQIQQNEGFERHCILVAASNPYSLPTHVYRPPHKSETSSETCLCDAKTVAKSFPQSCVSLSVICPTQLPKLEAIYHVGKRNPSTGYPTIDIVKNPLYTVLISENFMEACAALSPAEIPNLPLNQSPIKMEATSLPPDSTVNESLLNQQSTYEGNIFPASVKVEPSTVSSALAGGTFTGISSIGKNPMGATSSGTVQVAPQSVGVNNNMAANKGLPQQTSSAQQSRRSEYVKIWEGDLYGTRHGQPKFISRLEAYRKLSASVPLIQDWSSAIYIERLISQDHMNNKKYTAKSDFFVFRAMSQHGFLAQLQEKKLCAVIRLPSQTLLLAVSDKACRLIGMLLPGWHLLSQDMTVYTQQHQHQRVGTGTNQGTEGPTQLMG